MHGAAGSGSSPSAGGPSAVAVAQLGHAPQGEPAPAQGTPHEESGPGATSHPGGDQGANAAPAPQAPAASSQPPADHAGSPPGQAAPPRAMIDAGGNLVFNSDPQHDPSPPASSHGPGEPASHADVGLVGVTDQAHGVHDLYHHS